MNARILIAGIGNIFLGDDAFGVEVIGAMAGRSMAEGVSAVDFGIRSFDLAYALLDPWDAVIMVDAAPRGGRPGTLYMLQVDVADFAQQESGPADGHTMDPVKVLQLASSMGEVKPKIYVLGCEPADCGGDEGRMGLTEPVQAAVPQAVQMLEAFTSRLLSDEIATAA